MSRYDDLTSTLSRELEERAHAMDGSTLHLSDVRGRARSIRRRRTTGAVLGAAAAVALVVPTVALATHTHGTRNEPGPATQAPRPTTSAHADAGHQPARGVLDVSDLPSGAAPAIAYAQGGTIHRPDGSTVDVGHGVEAFTTLADGSVVYETRTPQGDVGVGVWSDTTSGASRTHPAVAGLAVNTEHTLVGWLSPTGHATVWQEPDAEVVDLGPVAEGSEAQIASIAGDDCTKSRPSSVCELEVNTTSPGGHRQPWVVTPDGADPLRDGSFLTVADQTEGGLTIGLDQVTDDGSCSKLLGGGELQGFSTCADTLVSFSPDDTLVLADPAYHDGLGNGVIAMYDLEGHRLFQRTSDESAQSFYPTAQWEDATHVLAPVFQDGRWAVVRIASDGSMEYAVPPVSGDMEESPFVVETTH
jgi:hypothetical protein